MLQHFSTAVQLELSQFASSYSPPTEWTEWLSSYYGSSATSWSQLLIHHTKVSSKVSIGDEPHIENAYGSTEDVCMYYVCMYILKSGQCIYTNILSLVCWRNMKFWLGFLFRIKEANLEEKKRHIKKPLILDGYKVSNETCNIQLAK